MTIETRLRELIKIGLDRLRFKINGGRIVVDNEISMQLQLASILKSLGELYEQTPEERFYIELEKSVRLNDGIFEKSGTDRAKIDIWVSLENIVTGDKYACAIELKHFKKENQREPNNRYDVFKDLHNLERYGAFANYGLLVVATDHSHYINKESYSSSTSAFDFRNGRNYVAGTALEYLTAEPYGPPITLRGSYAFNWLEVEGGLSFMLLEVPYK